MKRCIGCGKERPKVWRGKGWQGVQPLAGKRFSYWACPCLSFDDLHDIAQELCDRGLEYPEQK